MPQGQAPFPDEHLAQNQRPRHKWALPTPSPKILSSHLQDPPGDCELPRTLS